MTQTRYQDIPAYTTKDGSEIRELMHPDVHGPGRQSLAEARLPTGGASIPHRHPQTEEIYHFTAGSGRMRLGEERLFVVAGDTVRIPPGVAHQVENSGPDVLVFLCCCSPAYSHEDTELLAGSLDEDPGDNAS